MNFIMELDIHHNRLDAFYRLAYYLIEADLVIVKTNQSTPPRFFLYPQPCLL